MRRKNYQSHRPIPEWSRDRKGRESDKGARARDSCLTTRTNLIIKGKTHSCGLRKNRNKLGGRLLGRPQTSRRLIRLPHMNMDKELGNSDLAQLDGTCMRRSPPPGRRDRNLKWKGHKM